MVSGVTEGRNCSASPQVGKSNRLESVRVADQIHDHPLGNMQYEHRKDMVEPTTCKKTPECLEYVILHELVHLVEKSHNAQFVSLMDKHMPMWREIKATLNGQTLDYME